MAGYGHFQADGLYLRGWVCMCGCGSELAGLDLGKRHSIQAGVRYLQLGRRERGWLACLDVRAYRRRDGISRRTYCTWAWAFLVR